MIKVKIQTDAEDNALDIIKTAISAEIKRLEIGLQKTISQIQKFENEYKVSSEVFKNEFTAESLKKGDREYVEWMGELKIRDRISEDLKKLKAIEYGA